MKILVEKEHARDVMEWRGIQSEEETSPKAKTQQKKQIQKKE